MQCNAFLYLGTTVPLILNTVCLPAFGALGDLWVGVRRGDQLEHETNDDWKLNNQNANFKNET